jgi:ABC-2 type transport system ATP-binding protein
MTDHAVVADGLLKRYGTLTALRDATFRVRAGSITGFVGRNGAGKTTTLKIISTLLRPDDGRCHVFGADVTTERWKIRERLGFLPDVFAVPTALTLREYLEICAHLYGLRGTDLSRRVETSIQLTRTDDFAKRRLHALSRGEQQRVGLARALIHNPDLLVLDEPASGLDPHARVELKELLRLLRERGKTVFLSSHVLADLEEICDELVVIMRGSVIFSGDTAAFRRQMRTAARWRLVTLAGAPSAPSFVPTEVVGAGPNWVDVQGDLSLTDRARWVSELVRNGLGVAELSPQQSSLEQEFAKAVEEDEEEELAS